MLESAPTLLRPWLALLLGVSLAGAGCKDRTTAVAKATAANTLLIGNATEPADLDPHAVTGSPEARLVQALFEGLVRYDPATLDPLPGVAERWELDPDGVTYTFYLRADARWSDGRPVTAHDFRASFQRILAPEFGSDNADALHFLAGAADFNRGRITDFDTVGCTVIDDRTLRLRAARPTPFFVRLLAARNWFPVPVHVLAQHDALRRQGTAWTRPEHLVGNGPFVLKAWYPHRHIELERSPTYWNRDAIALSGVRVFPIENANAEEAAYRAGQLHKTFDVPATRLEGYRRDRPEELRIAPQSGTYYYAFNVRRPPFDDARVRRALALALDRPALTRDVTRAGEEPARHFLPDGVAGYTSSVPGVDLDLVTARRLLAEAGYPEGRGFPTVTLLFNTSENHRVLAEAVQQMWRTGLGIDVRLENQEWKVYVSNMHLGNFDLCRAGYMVAPDDPSRFLESQTTGHGFNITGWSDPDYDAWLDASRQETDPVRRAELFARLQARLIEAMPVAPVYHYSNKYLLRPEVRGWSDNLMAEWPLREANLQP